MAKKAPRNKVKPGVKRPTLASLRAEIDRIDRELIHLMNQRAGFALEIGKLKEAEGQPVYNPEREEEVIRRALDSSDGPLQPECIRAIFRELMSGSRALQKKLRVAFLGPEFSYSHLAGMERFGQSVDWVGVANIAAVFESVNRGDVDFGIVPLENSTDGRIVDTLDMFTRLPVRICGEVPLRIHHHLLAKCPRHEIREIYSKPQALSQCREWIAKHLPAAKTVSMTSTAASAELARDKPGAAAIASREAGIFHGLEILASNIEDNQGNVTRFAVIADEPAAPTGRDKTALMFQVPHKPGSLADALALFKKFDLNLTWIESFPIPGRFDGYLFFVEFNGHQEEPQVHQVIETLAKKSLRLEVLGSFPISRLDGK